jgi:hypothetical protein
LSRTRVDLGVSVAFGSWWCCWFLPVRYGFVCVVSCGGGRGAPEFFPVREFQIDSGAGVLFGAGVLDLVFFF